MLLQIGFGLARDCVVRGTGVAVAQLLQLGHRSVHVQLQDKLVFLLVSLSIVFSERKNGEKFEVFDKIRKN
jgi:hypothetical protein